MLVFGPLLCKVRGGGRISVSHLPIIGTEAANLSARSDPHRLGAMQRKETNPKQVTTRQSSRKQVQGACKELSLVCETNVGLFSMGSLQFSRRKVPANSLRGDFALCSKKGAPIWDFGTRSPLSDRYLIAFR